MTDQLDETSKNQLAAAFAAEENGIAEIRKQIETTNLDREQLIDRLATMMYRNKLDRAWIKELQAMRRKNAYYRTTLQEKGKPPVEVVMLKVNEENQTGEERFYLQPYYTAEAANAQRAHAIAAKGGEGRAAKYKLLEAETIRLYTEGNWKSAAEAAHKITPVIVKMSKGDNGNLLDSTTKPLEWIRAYNKAQKKEKVT